MLSTAVVGPMPSPATPDNPAATPSISIPSPDPGHMSWYPGDGTDAPPPMLPPDPSAGQTSTSTLSIAGQTSTFLSSSGQTSSSSAGGQTSTSSPSDPEPPPPPHDRFKNHVALAEADIQVNGVKMQEFALADAGTNKVLVKVGFDGSWTELGSAQGINSPQSVLLADVNGDGLPDLVVANSGANNVLVFPGLPGGLIGPEANGGQGFSVGTNPVGVTVGDVNAHGLPDLIVANKGSNNLSILDGQGTGSAWTLVLRSTIEVAIPASDPAVVGPAPAPVASSMTMSSMTAPAPDPSMTMSSMTAPAPVAASMTMSTATAPAPDPSTATAPTATISAPAISTATAPVKTVLYDLNHDGLYDLFVCNSGSNNVYMYQGRSDGTFDTANPTIFAVGLSPIEMFIGRFDKRPQLDLITVNSGSDDLTFIGGVLLPHPSTMTISSGGITPDAAFAVDPNHTGVMDLVVANSGDGHMALFQAGNEGLQLAGVITRAGIPVPTGLVPSYWDSGGIDFFAAGAGQDAAQLLHFDLGTASDFLATPFDVTGPGDELFAQLLSFDDSSLELMAVYWTGSPDSRAIAGEWGLRESSTITALYSPTEGQGADESTPTSEVVAVLPPPAAAPTDPLDVDTSALTRFVLGLDVLLGEPRGVVEAIAARDAREIGDERPFDDLARLDRRPIGRPVDRPFDPDVEAAAGAVDEALRLFWSESPGQIGPEPVKSVPRFDTIRELEGIDAPARDGRLELVPAVTSALLFSTRLILKASPPRPPSFRRKPGLRPFGDIWGTGPGRDRPDRV